MIYPLIAIMLFCSSASSNLSSRLIYLFIRCVLTVIIYNMSSPRLSCLDSTIVEEDESSYILFSLIISYTLNLMICIGVIMLDDMFTMFNLHCYDIFI
jgi:hypothetical protein